MDDDDHYGGSAHWLLLGVAMLVILGSLLVSARPVTLGNVPDVLPIADIPVAADREELRRYIWSTSYEVPRTRVRPQIAAALDGAQGAGAPQPRLGWSIRQVSFLGLPLFAYRELGPALYLEEPMVLRTAPIGEDGAALLTRQVGRDLSAGWVFPVWTVAWGWIVPLLVAAFGLLEARRQRRRRTALGLI